MDNLECKVHGKEKSTGVHQATRGNSLSQQLWCIATSASGFITTLDLFCQHYDCKISAEPRNILLDFVHSTLHVRGYLKSKRFCRETGLN